MSETLAAVSALADVTPSLKDRPSTPPPTAQQPQAVANSDVRLLIEKNREADGFVYKLVDSVSGQLLNEIPDETVKNLSIDAAYDAGDVISTVA